MRDWSPRQLTAESAPSRLFVLAALAAYVALTAYVSLHHEPWRDEADAWLFARDGNFAHIVSWSRHAGTPTLWYWLLAPLAKGGLPYGSQKVLHLIVTTAAMAIFLTRAPLTRLTKLLALFSYFFAYEYAVIVRSYALSVLLVFAAAALRRRPLGFALAVALLFNTNAQGFFVAAAFALVFVIERRRDVIPILIMAAGAFAAWLQVRAPIDPMRSGQLHPLQADALPWTIGNAFLPAVPTLAGCVIGVALLVALTLALRHSRVALLMLWLPILTLGALYSFVWIGGLRHAGFFLVAALAALWMAGDAVISLPVAALLLNGTLLVSAFVTVRAVALDVNASFSGAEEMAAFIQHLDQRPIAAHNLTQCEALLPYLPGRRFWYAGLKRDGTYLNWDAAMERALDVPYPAAEVRVRRRFGRQPFLLLFNVEIPNPAGHGFRLLYTNRLPIYEKTDERYWLYQPLDQPLESPP
jgi:hypothetical protein